jgi:hypothetical protein
MCRVNKLITKKVMIECAVALVEVIVQIWREHTAPTCPKKHLNDAWTYKEFYFQCERMCMQTCMNKKNTQYNNKVELEE